MSVTLLLADDLDVSRGDLIGRPEDAPQLSRDITATVCWMTDQPLRAGSRYTLKHATHTTHAIIQEIIDRTDIHTLTPDPDATELRLNEIGRVHLRTAQPLAHDPYTHNRATGSFILIDQTTNDTTGAGMILGRELRLA